MWMHILRGVLIADIKGKGERAFVNANGYLGWISTLQRTVFRMNTRCNVVDASSAAKPIVPPHWRLVAKQYMFDISTYLVFSDHLYLKRVLGRIIRGYQCWRTWRGVALKPGKTSVANQAWTSRATRRQQITDLINDRRASARLIVGPKNLGTKWDGGGSGVFRFADINTWWGMHVRATFATYLLIQGLAFWRFIKSSFFVVKGRLEILRTFIQFEDRRLPLVERDVEAVPSKTDVIPDICHFLYTGKIFRDKILHPKARK